MRFPPVGWTKAHRVRYGPSSRCAEVGRKADQYSYCGSQIIARCKMRLRTQAGHGGCFDCRHSEQIREIDRPRERLDTRSFLASSTRHRPLCGWRTQRAGEATLNEAAEVLVVSSSTIRQMINTGLLPAEQLCKGAPWVVKSADLQREDIQRESNCRRSRRPASHNPYQAMLDL